MKFIFDWVVAPIFAAIVLVICQGYAVFCNIKGIKNELR